jgi:anti-sigma regulatory factor (Ser/Thr protein kinase)
MKLRSLILKVLFAAGEVRSVVVARKSGVSRTYVHRTLQQLEREGVVRLVGKANKARYVSANPEAIDKALASELVFRAILRNDSLEEDRILERIKAETGIFRGISPNVARIVDYGFTEMLNNAIEHSHSLKIEVRMGRTASGIHFTVLDRGIGILRNIMQTRNLGNEQEALQDLMKGRLTTMPGRHSGEGIFFTSRSADGLMIRSAEKKILFDNLLSDVFVRTVKPRQGTQVDFWVSLNSKRELASVFREFTGEGMTFDKTRVLIALFKAGAGYVSRSQARRVLTGLEGFREIVLDFAHVEVVGQAFADEVFRVWQSHHPTVVVRVENASQDVRFMIDHVSHAGPFVDPASYKR